MSKELWEVQLGRGIGPIELGATREEVIRRLAEVGIEIDADEEDDWFWVEGLEAELYFKTTTPQVLHEIIVEGDRVRFASRPVIGQRLHEVVELLQVPDAETLWRERGDEDERGSDEEERAKANEVAALSPKDEDLLDWGTLWIPPLGLGLSMLRGEIDTVRLRKPEESPRRGVGTLTPAQRELSARKDLPTYLIGSTAIASRPTSLFQKLLGLALAASLGWVVWSAVDYQRKWNAAPVVEGVITAVDPPPPEPFPMKFTIAYRDLAGGEHTTVMERADTYAFHVGDKVDIRYLPAAPDQPMGPSRLSDAAFLKYVPWGIGIFAGYLVLQVVVAVGGLVVQRMKSKAGLVPVAIEHDGGAAGE